MRSLQLNSNKLFSNDVARKTCQSRVTHTISFPQAAFDTGRIGWTSFQTEAVHVIRYSARVNWTKWVIWHGYISSLAMFSHALSLVMTWLNIRQLQFGQRYYKTKPSQMVFFTWSDQYLFKELSWVNTWGWGWVITYIWLVGMCDIMDPVCMRFFPMMEPEFHKPSLVWPKIEHQVTLI